ncbi:MAG: hypothetical protein KBT29_11680 [Prevotellaceae bacterium]|nr:hypothetical protein [Candidatus Minthosoma caballi]
MNLSVYLFGDLSSGYTQYPNDYTKSIFEKFYQNSQATTQIAIHRDGDLIYYGYIRKLEDRNYLGFCTVINGKMITQIDQLFGIYEGIIETMVRNGYLIHFNDKGEVESKIGHLYENKEEIDLISSSLQSSFNRLEGTSKQLPSVSYAVSKDSVKSFSIQDSEDEILKSSYTNGYTFVYKSKGFNTAQMNSYKGIISRKDKEINELLSERTKLKNEVSSLKNKQRNTTWVAILGFVAVILFGVVYVKVLNPREVTKKNMGKYVYYGPMKNGEPKGTGVAIYHANDKDGRLYYYGNFTNGKRIDNNAIMFYKDGSYFKGSMNEDKWNKGLFFDVEKEHFIGEFRNNIPWKGDWYKHVKEQTIVNGK